MIWSRQKKESQPKKNICIRITSAAINYIPRVFPESWSRRFQSSSYLQGNFLLGKGLQLMSKDGHGSDRLVTELGRSALNNIKGNAYCYLSPFNIAFMTVNPASIEALISSNHDNMYWHDSTGSFELIFGDTIFSKAYGTEEHKAARAKYTATFGTANRLKNDAVEMQKLCDEKIRTIYKNGIVNISDFSSMATMEIIGKLKLGFNILSPETQKKSATIISHVTTEVASGKLQVSKKVFGKKLIHSTFGYSHLGKLIKQGEDILRREIVYPNSKNITSTENWLNQDEKHPVDLTSARASKKTIDSIKEVFVAGHDTTKVLLRACIMLLADEQHQNVVKKLLAEFAEMKSDPSTWTRDDIEQLKYLNCIVKEALRLYPPVPDMVFSVKKTFPFVDGKLYTNDVTIISPRFVHRNTGVWGEDAEKFNPDRFKEFKNDDKDAYRFFPFGFKPKICPGQHFAQLEVKVLLVRLLSEFHFEFVNKNLHHPFPFHQVFTLRFENDDVQIKFTPRNSSMLLPSRDRQGACTAYKGHTQ